ncbi:MAG: centrin, EF-hand protein [Vezdaea aestivalis]|nr:MAG: centrin, EF-hand protein [Vezdaea aestivalis]
MPPRKRARSSKALKPAKPTPRSSLAKSANISAAQESSIREAFSLFAISGRSEGVPSEFKSETDGVIRREDVRRVLISLGTPPADKSETVSFLEALDPTETGFVTYAPFVAVAALKIRAREKEEPGDEDGDGDVEMSDGEQGWKGSEVGDAFQLFTKGGDGPITLGMLRRVARELKEDVDDEMLSAMLSEAGGPMVDREMFAEVMRRAGVF